MSRIMENCCLKLQTGGRQNRLRIAWVFWNLQAHPITPFSNKSTLPDPSQFHQLGTKCLTSLRKSFSFKLPLKINILFWKILLEGLRLSKEPEGQDICCEILSSIYDKKVACMMRSQRRKQLSKTCTMTMPVGMPRWTGKSHTVLCPNEGCLSWR